MNMYCDDCNESGEYQGNFIHCINSFREDGWKITPDGRDGYTHKCPDCIRKETEMEHDKL